MVTAAAHPTAPARAAPVVTPAGLRRAMNLNIAAGSLGIAWYVVCGPQNILNVLVMNWLGGSASELGLLVALMQFAGVFHLVAIVVYSVLPRRKLYWMATHITQRLLALVLAAAAIYVGRGGDRHVGIVLITIASTVSWVLTHASSSGWWSWWADLVPETSRATFFGRRSSLINAASMSWFFLAAVAIDTLRENHNIFYVHAGLFILAAVLGIADILMFARIPEPAPVKGRAEDRLTLAEFLEPVRNPNFRTFCLAVGLFGLSVAVAGPFIPPYITSTTDGIGAPMTWLGIMAFLTQMTWIVTAQPWGMVMDRFGRKPAVLLGALFPFTWILYLLLTPQNYVYILPIAALAAGAIIAGWGDGVSQLMLTLTPERNRTTYVAWYMAISGMIAGVGSLCGGWLYEGLRQYHAHVGSFTLSSFHAVIVAALVLCTLSIYFLSRIREGRNRPVSFVLSRLATPGIVRTFRNLNTLASPADSEAVARALRSFDGSSSALAVSDIVARLDDPNHEVCSEAVRALGRTRSPEAVDALLLRLCDLTSPIRTEAARALGKLGDHRAVPFLVAALEKNAPEEFEEACVQALGAIGGKESARRLLDLLAEARPERVLATGAEAVSRLGLLEAAWEIFPRMHSSTNPVLRKQLTIAMANTLGTLGEFYQYVSGDAAQQALNQERLLADAAAALQRFCQQGPRRDDQKALAAAFAAEMANVTGMLHANLPREALRELHAVVRRLVERLTGRDGRAGLTDDILMECAFIRDARLGLGFWFINEVRNHLDSVSNPDILRYDALLTAFFLSRLEA